MLGITRLSRTPFIISALFAIFSYIYLNNTFLIPQKEFKFLSWVFPPETWLILCPVAAVIGLYAPQYLSGPISITEREILPPSVRWEEFLHSDEKIRSGLTDLKIKAEIVIQKSAGIGWEVEDKLAHLYWIACDGTKGKKPLFRTIPVNRAQMFMGYPNLYEYIRRTGPSTDISVEELLMEMDPEDRAYAMGEMKFRGGRE